jgi:hypothetical protein
MKLTIVTEIVVDGERLPVTVEAEYAASIAPRIQAGETDYVHIISVADDDGVEHEPTKAETERIGEELVNEILSRERRDAYAEYEHE